MQTEQFEIVVILEGIVETTGKSSDIILSPKSAKWKIHIKLRNTKNWTGLTQFILSKLLSKKFVMKNYFGLYW